MSNRYAIKFSKDGYIKYTSHLDLLRMFKRAFKKTGLMLKYSQGYNPHPKMGFAQPLSLGYLGKRELIEFETVMPHTTGEIMEKMRKEMPEGIELISCFELPENIKSLAADADAAEYKIWIPTSLSEDVLKKEMDRYLNMTEIVALKRQKKTKKMEPVNIRPMIRSLEINKVGDFAMIKALLDCGSRSNCSPELVISSFCSHCGIETTRYDMEVERTNIFFVNKLQY